MSIYDIKVKALNNEEISLDKYKNKVLLIVNTATRCMFTDQYEELEMLYENYHKKGLEILDFPCNQFGSQAPEKDIVINKFCKLKYGIKFSQFSKIEVNGKNEHPLYTFLKSQNNGLFNEDIKWNFTKFLVDRTGKVIKRYDPSYEPSKIEKDIIKLLK